MTADKILVRELVDYAKYDKLLEWQRLIPWINYFAAKKAKGKFNTTLAVKALGDYLTKDVFERYSHGGRTSWMGHKVSSGVRLDAATKLAFGKAMLTYLMPRINRTAEKMKKVGVVKGKLVKAHPGMR